MNANSTNNSIAKGMNLSNHNNSIWNINTQYNITKNIKKVNNINKHNSKSFLFDGSQPINLKNKHKIIFRKINKDTKISSSDNGTKESSSGSSAAMNTYNTKNSLQNDKLLTTFAPKSIENINKDIIPHNFNININSPEELHFFYVHIFKHGKNMENNF